MGAKYLLVSVLFALSALLRLPQEPSYGASRRPRGLSAKEPCATSTDLN